MREQVILAPGAGGTELMRTLARFGVNTLGLRVMSAPELAKTALTRAGVSLTEGFLTKREEPAVIFSPILPVISSWKRAQAPARPPIWWTVWSPWWRRAWTYGVSQ